MSPQPQPAHKSLEAQIVAVLVVLCGVAAGLHPAGFPPALAGVIATVSSVALLIQRTVLAKITAGSASAPELLGLSAPRPLTSGDLITMYDDVSSSTIPSSSQAVAGYCDGLYRASWIEDIKRFPQLADKQRVVSICVFTDSVARILDIEPGNPATPAEGAEWVKRMIAHGVYRPGIYADLSDMPAIKAALDAAGLRREQYVLWVAQWTGEAHIPDGYDACQWTDHGPNGCDVSLCKPEFFGPPAPVPPPRPKPKPGPHGTANSTVHFNVESKSWQVVGTPGKGIKWESPGREAKALLQINTGTGRWSVEPLPWDFKKP